MKPKKFFFQALVVSLGISSASIINAQETKDIQPNLTLSLPVPESPDLKFADPEITNDSADNQINLSHPEIMAALSNASRDVIYKTQAVVQGMAQLVGQQIKNVDTKAARSYLLEINKTLISLEEALRSLKSTDEIYQLMRLVQEIQHALKRSIKTGLKTLSEPALDRVAKRSVKTVDLAKIAQQIQASESLIEEIAREAEEAGLSTFNKFYRKLENLNAKYNLTSKAIYCTLAGALAAWALVQIDEKELPNWKWLKSLKNKVGEAPHYPQIPDPKNPKAATKPTNTKHLGWIGKIQHNLGTSLPVVNFAVGSIPLIMGAAALFKEPLMKVGEQIYNKFQQVRARLRGGSSEIQHFGAMTETPDGDETTFEDVVGCENAKQVLQDVIEFMKDPASFTSRGIEPDRGILFYGAPRTGKSMLARSLKNEIKRQLPPVQGDDFRCILVDSSKIGIGKEQFALAAILSELATLNKPSIIVIDEIDLIGLHRNSTFAQKTAHLGQMLSFMSGLIVNPNIIIIGITNLPDALDIALLQPGRFGRHIEFENPTYTQRKIFWERQLNKIAVVFDEETINRFVKETETATLEDIKFALARAVRAAKAEARPLREFDVYRALDEIIHGIRFERMRVEPEIEEMIAGYLSGQALAAYLLKGKNSIAKIALHPIAVKPKSHAEENIFSKEYGKLLLYKGDNADLFKKSEQLKHQIMLLIAGEAALEILYGKDANTYTYRKHEIDAAFKLIKTVKANGLSDEMLDKELNKRITKETYDALEQFRIEIRSLLKPHAEAIQKLQKTLIEKPLLRGNEIDELFEKVLKK